MALARILPSPQVTGKGDEVEGRSRLLIIFMLTASALMAGCEQSSVTLGATPAAAPDQPTAVVSLPTPTLVPTLPVPTPQIELLPPDAAPVPTPEPTVVAEPSPLVEPTAPPVEPTLPPATPVPPQSSQGAYVVIRLEDTDWSGGFRNPGGYRGRSATWVYGTSTRYTTMQATFALDVQPVGEATLAIEGMDSEGRAKTPISISVNGSEIYNGPNPLPDDEYPFQVGTWATVTWSFDARLLRPGQNTIAIRNLAPGEFSLPPFFMLDYAIVRAPLP